MSDEPGQTTELTETDEKPSKAPDPAFTLRAKSLAGSAQCLNCGTELSGPFCHYCGQPDRNFMRFFPALLREFMEEFLDLDSRFMRTMKPLLFRPGRLTRDYLEGRRFRYTPPLRLYLFASIGFFLLASTLSSNAINVGLSVDPSTGEPNLNISGTDNRTKLSDEQRMEDQKALQDAGVEVQESFLQELGAGRPDAAEGDGGDETFTADQIMVNGKPWNRETNPVHLQFAPDIVNEWINDEVEESPLKAKRIHDNPNLIVEQVFDILPGTMFVLLPVVALLFKFWYSFARRYYIEHLIYALHNHSFIFVSAIIILLFNLLLSWAESREIGWLVETVGWAITITAIWIPVYLLISLRRVYQQNWFMTVAKFAAIGLSYVTLLVFVTSVVAVMGFVLL